MGSKLMQTTVQASQLVPQLYKIKTQVHGFKSVSFRGNNEVIFKQMTSCNVSFKQSLRVSGVSEEHESVGVSNVDDINHIISITKSSLYHALEGINRGVFGVTSDKKQEIEKLVLKLEAHNPTTNPTLNLDKVSGCWKLMYSTITILGSKRTKLGLRDFINLGDFLQIVHVPQGKAVNVIKFNARGLSSLNGELTIQASFKVASPSRVNIKYDSSKITPNQLMNLFHKNYELLLAIFNPDGWLDITYVDEEIRIGRDNKGNMFILERVEDQHRT